MSRPARMIINLDALRHNVGVAKGCSTMSKVVAVLKANAYGHGAVEVAFAIEDLVAMFAVSSIEEALQLREAGIKKNILLLEGCFNASELLLAAKYNFTVAFHSEYQIHDLEKKSLPSPVEAWLKVDTGMHRLGTYANAGLRLYQRLLESDNTQSDVTLMTHMASADLLQEPYTKQQLALFDGLKQDIVNAGLPEPQTSIGNSGTIIGWPEAKSEYIRPGIMLYGLSPFAQRHPLTESLIPVMTLESEIIAIRHIETGERVGYGSTWEAQRPSRVATVAIGYGDGYPRNAKSGTPVLVRGARARLAGRVSMDMLSIDITHLPDVRIGDKVTLWGADLNANEVSDYADTIGYELVTRMPLRVPKSYILFDNH